LCRWRELLLDGDGAKASRAQLLKSPSPERTQPPSRASAAGLGEKPIEEVLPFPSTRGVEMTACRRVPVTVPTEAVALALPRRREAAEPRTQPPSCTRRRSGGEIEEVPAFLSACGAEMKARCCVSVRVRMGAAATLLGAECGGVRRRWLWAAALETGGGACRCEERENLGE
jgi:hypothetical protein